MRKTFLMGMIFAMLLCGGCSSANAVSVNADGSVQIGSSLLITPPGSTLTLSEQMDTLATDGLYYATWTIGEPTDYENDDGDTVDLYDAELYLLLGEFQSEEKASENADTWLAAAKDNYNVISEKDVLCGTVTYHVITYNCVSDTNPYDRGVSAFATDKKTAVCAELTCQADFDDDLATILSDFLEHCNYVND